MPTGLVIGRFMPPTMGHQYLLDFAHGWCGEELTIVVCAKRGDPISAVDRFAAIKEAYPDADVVLLEHDLPDALEGHPDFWTDWRRTLQRATGRDRFGFVFASDAYGARLAQEFEAQFVPVNIGRRAIQISATIVRQAIFDNWAYVMPTFRSRFVARVAVVGPESCGKTELCRDLAKHFQTEWCPEWARMFLEAEGNRYPVDSDYPLIAKAHAIAEDALAKQATRVLISDTDAVCTQIAAERLNNFADPFVDRLVRERRYDLRLVMGDDVPYAADPLRYGIDKRQFSTSEFEQAYRDLGAPFITIRGDWAARFTQAVTAIRQVLGEKAASVAA
ncbi:AAA family ATPase [Dongia sp.]|uniref:AAA family ATPase n=1 Tax=Dongia sp. TaxID=1977262 RepID=UPI0037503F7C